MMVCYVTVPSRLIGVQKSTLSRRDRVTAAAVGGAIGAVVCTPPYLLARLGLVMLGSSVLVIPGVILLAIGLMLQAGATSSVKAVKLERDTRRRAPTRRRGPRQHRRRQPLTELSDDAYARHRAT